MLSAVIVEVERNEIQVDPRALDHMHDTPDDDLFSRHDASRADEAGDDGVIGDTFDDVATRLAASIADFDPAHKPEVDDLTTVVMRWHDSAALDERRCRLLADACVYYQRIGFSFDGIPRGTAACAIAAERGFANLEGRACHVLGGVYIDSANFEGACRSLERSLVLARASGDPFLECVACSTTALLFKEMGCHVDAMAMIDKSLGFDIDTPQGEHLRFVNATHGLFSAHRLRDEEAALRYMAIGTAAFENPLIDAVTHATFEYNRALFLLSQDDGETAEGLIDAALERHARTRDARVRIPLETAAALCDWASHVPARQADARRQLHDLHRRSRRTRLHHDDVLRALMRVHGRPTSREDAALGVAYARELVEHTTRVKQAMFHRQMSDRGVASRSVDDDEEPASFGESVPRDVFVVTGRNSAVDRIPATQELDVAADGAADGAATIPSRDVRTHDEPTAFQEDRAAIRTASSNCTIRTVAYDIAESWALAAEFPDDRTGQHCFRVGRLAGLLAAEIGMDADYCLRIEHAARLHDIGKITVDEAILLKPGPLDPCELTAMRAHAKAGGALLQHAKDPTLQMAAVIARHHQEWWNGTG